MELVFAQTKRPEAKASVDYGQRDVVAIGVDARPLRVYRELWMGIGLGL